MRLRLKVEVFEVEVFVRCLIETGKKVDSLSLAFANRFLSSSTFSVFTAQDNDIFYKKKAEGPQKLFDCYERVSPSMKLQIELG